MTQRRNFRSNSIKASRSCGFESLEPRAMFAVARAFTSTFAGGKLTINCLDVDNHIFVDKNPATDEVRITDYGPTYDEVTPFVDTLPNIAANSVTEIEVNLDFKQFTMPNVGGDDSYRQNLTGYTQLTILDVNGYGGNDTIRSYGHVPEGTRVTIYGGNGNDGGEKGSELFI